MLQTNTAPRFRGGAADTAQLIDDLVYTACNSAKWGGQIGQLEAQVIHNRLFGYAMRVADSSIASGSAGDPEPVFHAIRQRLTQQNRHLEAAKFTDLYQQLCSYTGLSSRGRFAVLDLLQQLADHGAGAPASGIASYRPLQLSKVLPLKAGPAADTCSTASGDQLSKGLRSARATQQRAGTAAVPHQQPAVSGQALSMVKQPMLVKDALRVVQGFTGQYSCFCTSSTSGSSIGSTSSSKSVDVSDVGCGITLAPHGQLLLAPGMRTLLHSLGELGVLYQQVQSAIHEGRQPGAGSVRQALCAALQEEVTDFYRLMAVLEAQLAAPMPVPGGADTGAAAADSQGTVSAIADGSSCGPYLSLRRLQLWLAEPLRRMRLLAALVDASRGRVGGDLAGRVWAASKVGDPLARSYATRLLHQMCVPLFDMIRCWVFEGVLEDPACEFFVVPNTSAISHSSSSGSNDQQQQQGVVGSSNNTGVSRDLWRDAYRLEPAKLPPFIPGDLAATILRAGKSINFLRDACEDTTWVQDWGPAAAGAVAALSYGQLSVLECAVTRAGQAVGARLMAVLHSTGELDRHCQAIRRYLLLGQGDFVVALLDCLGPELSKPASEVSEVTLNHLLRGALLASAGGGRGDEEGGPQERLRAAKARSAGAGETGWDVFALHYQLGPPLSSIFTPAAQASYSRLSRLLWLLRRTERSLGIAWHTLQVEVGRAVPQFARDPCAEQLQALLRACTLLRSEMAHFTTNLQYYINLEVLECAWSEFMSAAAAAPDLDCLIAAHEKFLSSVLERALLGPGRAEGLRSTLQQLLANCMGLAPLVSRFNEKVQLGLRALEHKAARAAANTAAGQWGSTGGMEAALAPEELSSLTDTLGQLAARHRQLVRAFLEGLPAAANEVNAECRFLLARLDFSDFYTRGRQQAAAAAAATTC